MAKVPKNETRHVKEKESSSWITHHITSSKYPRTCWDLFQLLYTLLDYFIHSRKRGRLFLTYMTLLSTVVITIKPSSYFCSWHSLNCELRFYLPHGLSYSCQELHTFALHTIITPSQHWLSTKHKTSAQRTSGYLSIFLILFSA